MRGRVHGVARVGGRSATADAWQTRASAASLKGAWACGRAVRIVCLASVLALAGCLGGSEVPAPPPADVVEPLPSTLYLNAAGSLTAHVPVSAEPEAYDVGSFYEAWTAGEDQPTWSMENPFAGAIASAATLTYYYTSEAAVPTTGPQDQGFPEFVVYAGVEGAPMGWASVSGPDVVQADEVVEIVMPLSLPKGGLVIPAGTPPTVKIAPVQGQTDQNPVVLLLNSTQTPSRVDLTLEPFDAPAVSESVLLDTAGTLVGSAYALGGSEGTTMRSYPIELAPEALGLRVRMERVEGTGIADIDLAVVGPDGEVAAQSVTPEPREGVDLWLPNIEASGGSGTWTVQVTNYGNARADFRVDAVQLLPPAA